ncbi:hypothetical protein [Micromonospora sp. NPDC005367]|uniref:hypothetical protein n=1 Tax=Micromonospora sp. NPDC005367 TaxID=3155590 RepID=UPI0033BE9437
MVVAILALLISLTASYFGWKQNGDQQELAARSELSQLIQRMTALQRDGSEDITDADGQRIGVTERGDAVTETLALAGQAADIIDHLDDGGTASECYAVALAFKFVSEDGRTAEFAEKGLRKDPPHLTLRIGLLHVKACSNFNLGNYEVARDAMRAAIGARDSQSGLIRAYGELHSYTYWADRERTTGSCDEWEMAIGKARSLLEELAANKAARERASQWIRAVDSCPD